MEQHGRTAYHIGGKNYIYMENQTIEMRTKSTFCAKFSEQCQNKLIFLDFKSNKQKLDEHA